MTVCFGSHRKISGFGEVSWRRGCEEEKIFGGGAPTIDAEKFDGVTNIKVLYARIQ